MRCNAHTGQIKRAQSIDMFLDGHSLVQIVNGIATDIYVLREQLIRHFVLFKDVIVRPSSSKSRAKKETNKPKEITYQHNARAGLRDRQQTYPDLNEPTGLCIGAVLAALESSRCEDVRSALEGRKGTLEIGDWNACVDGISSREAIADL